MADSAASVPPLGERVRDLKLVERALARAVREALHQHKRAGNPVAVWRQGRTVWINPDEIELPSEDRSQ